MNITGVASTNDMLNTCTIGRLRVYMNVSVIYDADTLLWMSKLDSPIVFECIISKELKTLQIIYP